MARHARATQVDISLRQEGDALVLTVQDNGVGFPPRALQREGSYGLLGMRAAPGCSNSSTAPSI